MHVSERARQGAVAATVALAAPLTLAAVLSPFRSSIANTDVALALVAVIVGVAANGHRLAGLLAALLSAVWFDVFFTQPYGRLSITSRPDVETTVLLLVIGVAVTELAVAGRHQRVAASRRAGYLAGIHAAAEAVAAGQSPSDVVQQASSQLIQLLSLHSCRFQRGVAGLGNPPLLRHDGTVVVAGQVWDVDGKGFPPGTETELLAESGGILRGRFLLMPSPDARPTLEQRLVAAALADEAGAAFG